MGRDTLTWRGKSYSTACDASQMCSCGACTVLVVCNTSTYTTSITVQHDTIVLMVSFIVLDNG